MSNPDPNTKPPTDQRVAVALSYDDRNDPAPRVSASGKGPIAEHIIALAESHSIPIREDADLAELLGKLDLDSFIPVEAFVAVAEILAYVYRQNNKLKEPHAPP